MSEKNIITLTFYAHSSCASNIRAVKMYVILTTQHLRGQRSICNIKIHIDEFIVTLDYYSYSHYVIDEDDLL